jgi:orotate phosphoribosyltransferase
VIRVVEKLGGKVLAAGSIIDRSGGRADVGVPRVALESLKAVAYQPEDCPLCKDGVPVVKPGSRRTEPPA